LIKSMFTVMDKVKGVGLAAVQVGWPVRLFVLQNKRQVFINPVITRREGSVISQESCLSIPGTIARVPRAEEITLVASNVEGVRWNQTMKGLLAHVVQHEMDHLDGILIIDKAPNYRPFPWKCMACAKNEVRLTVIPYDCECNVHGVLHPVHLDALEIPICSACGELVFTVAVDEQIETALEDMLDGRT